MQLHEIETLNVVLSPPLLRHDLSTQGLRAWMSFKPYEGSAYTLIQAPTGSNIVNRAGPKDGGYLDLRSQLGILFPGCLCFIS